MKKILFVMSLWLLSSCINTNPNNDQLERDEHRQGIRKTLSLNNGEKWNLDQNTRANVVDLKSLLHRADEANLASVAVLLRSKTDELVKECRMEGPGHEALHAWLENFIEDQKLVNNPEMPPSKVLQFLRADLQEFDTYFR